MKLPETLAMRWAAHDATIPPEASKQYRNAMRFMFYMGAAAMVDVGAVRIGDANVPPTPEQFQDANRRTAAACREIQTVMEQALASGAAVIL